MKKIKKYFCPVLFFTCVCFSYAPAETINGDSLKWHYPLSDPRNPNCSCHKYQKIADKEFKKYKEHELTPAKNFSIEEKTVLSYSKARRINYLFKNKNPAKARQARQLKKSSAKRKKLWRRKSKIDKCKHW